MIDVFRQDLLQKSKWCRFELQMVLCTWVNYKPQDMNSFSSYDHAWDCELCAKSYLGMFDLLFWPGKSGLFRWGKASPSHVHTGNGRSYMDIVHPTLGSIIWHPGNGHVLVPGEIQFERPMSCSKFNIENWIKSWTYSLLPPNWRDVAIISDSS